MENMHISFQRLLPRVAPTLFALPVCMASTAHAQSEYQVFRPQAGLSATYDSNVLGLGSASEAMLTTNSGTLSDTSRTTFAGLDIDKKLSRQAFAANLIANHTRFDRLSELDYDGYKASADWTWGIGNNLDGKAGYSRVFSLAPFTNFHRLERNTYTVERQFANASWKVLSEWRLRAGVARYGVGYDLALQQRFNRNERQGEVGIDYLTRRANLVSLQWRRINGRFPNQSGDLASDFRQDQLELKTNWLVSGKTTIDFVGGRVARVHPGLAERDFHGYNGRLLAKMAVSDKTAISASAWRETGIFDDASTSYSTNRGLNLTARWAVTEKTVFEGAWNRERRDFTRPLRLAALPDYRDILRTAQLTMTYSATTHLEMQLAFVATNKATSNGFGEYGRRATAALARYHF
jgi:exopolysaccharide biosynthesis operon protein EpsL